ncbi:hypothetical protein IW152_005590 [Coemansia sp. BCRC 34962]|nr:hypothetical protein IW152_005590 [Coemansia sp. BCRC 34962]
MQKRKVAKPIPLGLGLKKKQPTQQDETAPSSSAIVHRRAEKLTASVFDSATFVDDGTGCDDEKKDEELAMKEANHKKKRNLDLFLEEIRRDQEQREHKAQRQSHSGQSTENPSGEEDLVSRSNAAASEGDDGVTTNLYLGNLPPQVDEQTLCLTFAKYGPIGSFKIMWPCTPEEHGRQHNRAFVSFMDRECAAKAIRAMDGKEFHGCNLRIAWGKPVPIPSSPVFVLSEFESQKLSPTGHPFNAKRPVQAGRMFANTSSAAIDRRDDDDTMLEVHVTRPLDHKLVRLIHWTVEHVIKNGPEFECLLISKTCRDARFLFLTQHELPEHVYYRWRMYSLLNGDTKSMWRDQMFFMYDRGPIWIPPKIERGEQRLDSIPAAQTEMLSSEAEERAERPRDRLSQRARDRFVRRVRRACRPEHGVIAEAMAFAVEHAYAAKEVVGIVCDALLDASASPMDKLCKLMLISDILHNSSAQVANAWRLRQSFEKRLGQIFSELAAVNKAIEARLKAEHFRKQVLAVLAVWEAWMMFPQETLLQLADKFK